MIEVELLGESLAPEEPSEPEVARLCELAAASRGVRAGHVAIEFVSSARIAELNARHRGNSAPTDVLSFPIDGAEPLAAGADEPQRELGDVVICPRHTADVREAIVHGMLHLLGMDHETDGGEMLALQDRLLREQGV
jgi:probable rRNA maturation factor